MDQSAHVPCGGDRQKSGSSPMSSWGFSSSPVAWVCRLEPVTPQAKKKFSYYFSYYSLWFSTMWGDSRIDMKIGLQLSYHDAAAWNGKVPPTTRWDHIFFCLSIFNAVPRYLGDQYIIISSTFKGVESSSPIFHFKPLFCGSSASVVVFQEQCSWVVLRDSLLKLCAKLIGLALYYQGDLFDLTALLFYPLAESTLH